MKDICSNCGCDKALTNDRNCPICGERGVHLKIYKHTGNGHWVGSYVIVSAVSQEMAEQFIRTKLDACGLEKEELNVHEVKNATTQSSLILCVDGDY